MADVDTVHLDIIELRDSYELLIEVKTNELVKTTDRNKLLLLNTEIDLLKFVISGLDQISIQGD